MSIEAKHRYRFGYLKSDKWLNLRLEKLVAVQAKCDICDLESSSNDAHHIFYRESVWDTQVDDLAILCRRCHTAMHCFLNLVKRPTDNDEAITLYQGIKTALRFWMAGLDVKVNQAKDTSVAEFQIQRCIKIAYKLNYKPGCKICGRRNADTQPRNILEDKCQVEWDFSRWLFCDGCFKAFKASIPWPDAGFRRWFYYANFAKKWYVEIRRKNRLKKNQLTQTQTDGISWSLVCEWRDRMNQIIQNSDSSFSRLN